MTDATYTAVESLAYGMKAPALETSTAIGVPAPPLWRTELYRVLFGDR